MVEYFKSPLPRVIILIKMKKRSKSNLKDHQDLSWERNYGSQRHVGRKALFEIKISVRENSPWDVAGEERSQARKAHTSKKAIDILRSRRKTQIWIPSLASSLASCTSDVSHPLVLQWVVVMIG